MQEQKKKKNFKLLYAYGRPFAPFYSFAMALRAALYQKGVFRVHRLPVPVVSVGNLTMGGTGKTPMVVYLAQLLSRLYKPVIVSRGYGGRAREAVNVISDGSRMMLEPPQAADEASMMAHVLKHIPVLTGVKRAVVGRYGIDRFGADLVLLDDGFQHQALHRDLNLVLFKTSSFLGNSRVFPGGDMREPLAALGRAHAFVLTCVDEENCKQAEAYQKALLKRFPHMPVFLGHYSPVGLVGQSSTSMSLDQGRDLQFFAFCGLAQPDTFQRTLVELGFTVSGFQPFKDHQPYSERKIDSLVRQARSAGAQALLTTEKDFVKIKKTAPDLPIFALKMEVKMEEDFDRFVLDSLSGL